MLPSLLKIDPKAFCFSIFQLYINEKDVEIIVYFAFFDL